MLETLSKDNVMYSLIQKYGVLTLNDNYMQTSGNLFQDLSTTIIRQQLSNRVADIILQRLENLLNKEMTPNKLLSIADEELRSIGLSMNKVNYIKNIAHAIQNGHLKLDELYKLNEQEIRECLTKIKGIGSWTVDMFLIFSLHFPDIFSFGDAGLNKAIQNLYGNNNILTKQQIFEITEHWRPFRSYACLYLWRSLDN